MLVGTRLETGTKAIKYQRIPEGNEPAILVPRSSQADPDPEQGANKGGAEQAFQAEVRIAAPSVGGAHLCGYQHFSSVAEHRVKSQVKCRDQRQSTLDCAHLSLRPESPGGPCPEQHAEDCKRGAQYPHSHAPSLAESSHFGDGRRQRQLRAATRRLVRKINQPP